MYVPPPSNTFLTTQSNVRQTTQVPMQIPSNNATAIPLSHEHRTRLYQIVNELTDAQLRLFLTNVVQSISNVSLASQFQHYMRAQLIQQAYILINNNYSIELEHTLYAVRQNRLQVDYQQQQQVYRPPQQQQQRYTAAFNQPAYFYNPPGVTFNVAPNYRAPATVNVAPPMRPVRPNMNVSHQRAQQKQQRQQTPTTYTTPILPRLVMAPQPSSSTTTNTATAPVSHYQAPILPPPSTVPPNISRPIVPAPPLGVKVKHKSLPFYRPLACVYESHDIFRFDAHRNQFLYQSEFILSLDASNQLAMSYYYDAELDVQKTSKCLILRLTRPDQPPMPNGKYDDNLPPNLIIQINSQNVTNLPMPKPCTRQQVDLLRVGREVDITSYCMFNPMLSNEIMMSWSYRKENINLHVQYMNAQYALHIFLVQRLSVDDLCEQIKAKLARFYRDDFVELLAKAIATDRDLGLEVSDLKLKLKCPIDQRRLKTPIRAVTCQHVQCFDLKNYIALNEKSGKWTCPVCNKPALFEDLQIDSYTESIMNSIENDNITEISIDSNLNWTPVTSLSNEQQNTQITPRVNNVIMVGNRIDSKNEQPDTKPNIHLISSPTTESGGIIVLDDD